MSALAQALEAVTSQGDRGARQVVHSPHRRPRRLTCYAAMLAGLGVEDELGVRFLSRRGRSSASATTGAAVRASKRRP